MNCGGSGRNITYLEQTLVLASLIHRFEFELPSKDWELEHTEAFNCSPSDMPVKVRKRTFDEKH